VSEWERPNRLLVGQFGDDYFQSISCTVRPSLYPPLS